MVSPSPPPKGPSIRRVPEGDDRARLVCPDCGFVNYENPKIVVGSVARWEDQILMVRRSIEPRSGFWTLPAGYLELNETTEAGALREAAEEANALIEIDGLLAIYSIPRISQVQLIYRARLLSPDVAPGREAHEVALYRWQEIPWSDIAFPSVHWALNHFHDSLADTQLTPRGNPPEQLREAARE